MGDYNRVSKEVDLLSQKGLQVYRYFGVKVYAIWVHGPLAYVSLRLPKLVQFLGGSGFVD